MALIPAIASQSGGPVNSGVRAHRLNPSIPSPLHQSSPNLSTRLPTAPIIPTPFRCGRGRDERLAGGRRGSRSCLRRAPAWPAAPRCGTTPVSPTLPRRGAGRTRPLPAELRLDVFVPPRRPHQRSASARAKCAWRHQQNPGAPARPGVSARPQRPAAASRVRLPGTFSPADAQKSAGASGSRGLYAPRQNLEYPR